MPSIVLAPRSPFDGVLKPGRHGAKNDVAGVVVTPRTDLALAHVVCRKDNTERLCALVKASFGIDLPLAPRRGANGPTCFIWAGPQRWLAATRDQMPHTFEQSLREALSGVASLTSQSDGRSIVRVGGPKARETLAKGLPLDLDPRAFGPGDVAMTTVGHINVHFWQYDATPSYELAVFRSFAASFCEWLVDAAAEFGVTVDGVGSNGST